MIIREFKVKSTNQVYEGHYLPDGSGDVQLMTNKGHELFFEWEIELI